MPLSDRLRRLEHDRRKVDVEVWVDEPDGILRNARTGERRRAKDVAALTVTLTIDRAGDGEDALPWD